MFCPSCGKSNPDDSKFCESCGTTLSGSAQAPASSSPGPSSYQSPPPPSYTPPQQQNYNAGHSGNRDAPLSVGQYVGMMLLGSLCFILWFVWAFGSDVNINKKNLAKAYLLLALIAIGVSIIFTALMLALGFGLGAAGGTW